MQRIDRDIHTATALVVDGNPTARSVMAAQLRDLGVGQVRQAARVQDARVALEQTAFDIVLCELDFDGAPMCGQQLLDELRREQLLPHSTVFLFVTAYATHAKVVDAAEATADGYLLKPYSGAALADRLVEARRRKRILDAVYRAISQGQLAEAAQACERHFDQASGDYRQHAGQVAGELWLRLEQPERALAVYERLVSQQAPVWAQAGVARSRLMMGEFGRARRLIDALIDSSPSYADAHELLARVLVEQGELDAALDAFRCATALTPGCVLRLQHTGALAFYLGDTHGAAQMMDRAVALGLKSKLFDALTLALLMLARHDLGDTKAVAHLQRRVAQMREAFPSSIRLRVMDQCAQVLQLLYGQDFDAALAIAFELADSVLDPAVDHEVACLILSLWARLPGNERPPARWDRLLRQVGMRHGINKTSTEILVGAARIDGPSEEILRDCHHAVMQVAERALAASMDGRVPQAVAVVLEQGERHCNARLIDMAGVLIQRHAQALDQAAELAQRVQALQAQWCRPVTHIAGIRRSTRTPGGVVLRR